MRTDISISSWKGDKPAGEVDEARNEEGEPDPEDPEVAALVLVLAPSLAPPSELVGLVVPFPEV